MTYSGTVEQELLLCLTFQSMDKIIEIETPQKNTVSMGVSVQS